VLLLFLIAFRHLQILLPVAIDKNHHDVIACETIA